MEFDKTINLRTIFIVHFILFFTVHLALPMNGAISRLLIMGMYCAFLFPLVVTKLSDTRFERWKIATFTGFILLVLAKLVLSFQVNTQLLYLLLLFLTVSSVDKKKEDVDWIIRVGGVLYLAFSLLLHYTPLSVLSLYEIRNLDNRLFGSLIFRFIGISGSPAGPDLIFTLILVYSIYFIPQKKTFDYINIVLSLVILVWTASLTPIFSLLLALPVIYTSRFRISYFLFGMYYSFIMVAIYRIVPADIQFILRVLTTLRVRIWDDIFSELSYLNSTKEWLIGRGETVEFIALGGEYDGNPHNIALFLLEFVGIIGLIIITGFLIKCLWNIRNKRLLFIFFIILFYGSMSSVPFTIYNDPVPLFLLCIVLLEPNLLEPLPSVTLNEYPNT